MRVCIVVPVWCNALQRTATHRSTLQHAATHVYAEGVEAIAFESLCYGPGMVQRAATHCNTLQHAATHVYAEED